MIACLAEARREGLNTGIVLRARRVEGEKEIWGTEILLIRFQLRDSNRVDDEGEGVTRRMERHQCPGAASTRARWPVASVER